MTQPRIRFFLIDHSKGKSPIEGVPFESPHTNMSTQGHTPHAVIYEVAHGGTPYHAVDTVTSNAVRTISRTRAHHKQNGGRIHLIGMLDQESPYGNRRVMEHTLRHMSESAHPFVIHALWYDPTPREYRQALHEIQSLIPAHGMIGSVAPVSIAHDYAETRKYFDGIMGPSAASFPHDIPLHRSPHFLDELPSHPQDTYIFLNSLNPFDRFDQKLRHELGVRIETLDSHMASPAWLTPMLNARHHVVGVSNRPHYLESYTGKIEHPYLETWVNDSSEALLEMLISPHFGYPQDPAHTVVIVDRENTPSFDWLIHSYIKANRHNDIEYYYVPTGRIAPLLVDRIDASTRSIAL